MYLGVKIRLYRMRMLGNGLVIPSEVYGSMYIDQTDLPNVHSNLWQLDSRVFGPLSQYTLHWDDILANRRT